MHQLSQSEKRCLFHLPMKISPTMTSGTSVRPVNMARGFEEAGYQVDRVWGSAQERKQAIEQVQRNLSNGVHYEFLYSESSTMPTILTERRRFAVNPFLDYGFFRMCHRAGIPSGLFYRDAQWLLKGYRQHTTWYRHAIRTVGWVLDLWVYRQWIDVLFLPHMAMRKHLWVWPERKRVQDLPPGAQIAPTGDLPDRPLKLLYVGSVHPLLHDISNLLEGVGRAAEAGTDVQLTLCCPEEQWRDRPATYAEWQGDWLHVVHASGDQLPALYQQNQLAMLYLVPIPYYQLAVPIKLYEAIGYGRPVIAIEGTAFGDLIEENGCGWSLPAEPQALASFLFRLQSEPARIREATHVTRSIQHEHTWKARAEQAAATLRAVR